MILLAEAVNDIKFDNEFLQLVALVCSLLTNISLLAIPLIVKQREESISDLKDKIEKGKIVEEELQKCLDELKAIQIICEYCENSSGVFSPYAEKAEIAAYYQNIIYQIHSKSKNVLEQENEPSNNRKKSNHRN